MSHLISVDQFDKESIRQLFSLADRISNDGLSNYQIDRTTVCTNLFYEPSTRTSSSFFSAMSKLGGSVIPINDVSFSSVSKGETLEDTIQVMAQYSDVIVLRHPEKGSAERAAAVSRVPIINGGDGVGEHPTQALLDLYTIYKHKKLHKPLKVALVGDLHHGRTVHSLVKLLRLYKAQIYLVSPPGFEMPSDLMISQDQCFTNLSDCIGEVDVVYMTRVQKERINDPQLLDSIHNYSITPELMQQASSNMILMHPLPRVNELPVSLDTDHRAKYFEQIGNGLLIRQAIFYSLFGRGRPCWNSFPPGPL